MSVPGGVWYEAKVIEAIKHGKNYWNTMKVGVFRHQDDAEPEQIGEYERNYSSFYNTFAHFKKNGKDYALYSPDYTSTRVMELPSCKDIGGEDRNAFGFCPVDLYVPWFDEDDFRYHKEVNQYPVNFGFVAGCVWGDDSSWKIQYLDLKDVEKGVIKRDDRFGYIELPDGMKLKDAISLRYYDYDEDDEDYEHDSVIEIALITRYRVNGEKLVD